MPGVAQIIENSAGLKLGKTSSSKVGMYGTTPVSRGAALTAQKATITIADAEGTPDTAIAAVTNSSPYGFSNAAEAITLLYTIQNLQTRLAEVEARLEAIGMIASN